MGQHGANERLQDYGYKLYDTVFDYSFDFVPGTEDETQLLLEKCKN